MRQIHGAGSRFEATRARRRRARGVVAKVTEFLLGVMKIFGNSGAGCKIVNVIHAI